MNVDPYTDPATGVLRNRLGLADRDRLSMAEAGLSFAAIADLGARILPGDDDLAHFQAFHLEIFGDIYPWAGQIRTVGIARTEPFCLPQHIHSFAAEVFGGLAKEDRLRGLSRDSFVDRVTHYQRERIARGNVGRQPPSEGDAKRPDRV
jgi:cell filamentation protein, protein adenylyltransferase